MKKDVYNEMASLHPQGNGHRPVVDEVYLHVGGELAGLHVRVPLAGQGHKVVV